MKEIFKYHLNFIVVIAYIILLTGCTSIENRVRETQGHLNKWVNQPVNELIDLNGLPDEVIRLDNRSISHIKKETWDSTFGFFAEIDKSSVQEWNDQMLAWVLLYRQEEQRMDGNYYACTQSYHINSTGIIIKVKEGWTSPDNENPCYIKYNIDTERPLTVKSHIENN